MPPGIERLKYVLELSKDHSVEEMAHILGVKFTAADRYVREAKRLLGNRNTVKARVLLIDIETEFGIGRFWGVWKQNMLQWQIIKPTCMLSWAAKWLFEPEIMGDIMTSEEAISRDDYRITKSLWHLMEEADIVISHNGKAFDTVRISTQFLLHGLGQPRAYQQIDTCLIARKYFSFEHNTLDYIAERLGLRRKIHTDNELWVKCDAGDKQALHDMLEYNKQDVLVLEDVYVAFRGWIKNHPALSLYHTVDEAGKKPMCRNCESTNLTMIGSYTTTVNSFDSYRCSDCGAIMRSRKSNTSLKRDVHILQGIS